MQWTSWAVHDHIYVLNGILIAIFRLRSSGNTVSDGEIMSLSLIKQREKPNEAQMKAQMIFADVWLLSGKRNAAQSREHQWDASFFLVFSHFFLLCKLYTNKHSQDTYVPHRIFVGPEDFTAGCLRNVKAPVKVLYWITLLDLWDWCF